jgi:hypothetical protein
MKLILCRNCQDVFKLSTKGNRTCECGSSGGRYLECGYNAVYWGMDAVPIGFANSTLMRAIRNRPRMGDGEKFTAFVMPKEVPSIRKIDRPKEQEL